MTRAAHWRLFSFVALIAGLVVACGRQAGGAIDIHLDTSGSPRARIRVTGLSSAELDTIRGRVPDDPTWNALMNVRVSGAVAGSPNVLGRYQVAGGALEFTPAFPFDPGRRYDVIVDPSQLPMPRAGAAHTATVALPAAVHSKTTVVETMYPSDTVVPENLLRIYLQFSAPMSRENGREFISLRDERGALIPDAFLTLDVDFWSPDRRRYTAFFDPGRVKRGILPNEQLGRALRSGQRVTVAVDARWRDENGEPLAAPFSRELQVGPADMTPIRLDDWTIAAPHAGTRDALVVSFPQPLDHGLLQRALAVQMSGGQPLAGAGLIGDGERSWRFVPASTWHAGNYDLVVLGILEDPAGNRIGRPFDIDAFEHIDRSPEPERHTKPFVVR